jgi:hypothetical protein
MAENTFKPGDHVVVYQPDQSSRHATILSILPEGTLAECRVHGEELGPGCVYPAFPIEWLELEENRTLEAKLVEKLKAWLQRAGPMVRDECDFASLTITLMQPGWDDDGTLHLEAKLEEEYTSDELGGAVPGVRGQR